MIKLFSAVKKYTFLSIIIISLSSCFNYEDVEIKDIKSIKLLEFSDKGLAVESQIQIQNPNNYKLSVVDSEFDVFIKNTKLGKAYIDGNLNIPSNSSDYHTIVLRSDYKDLASGAMSNMMALALGSKDIDFKVEGFIVGKAYFFRKKVKVSHSGKVPLQF